MRKIRPILLFATLLSAGAAFVMFVSRRAPVQVDSPVETSPSYETPAIPWAQAFTGRESVVRLNPAAIPRPPAVEPVRPSAEINGARDAIPGEHVLGFFDRNDRDKFITLAKARGAEILGVMDLGNSVRIRMTPLEDFEKLVRDGPLPIQKSANFMIYPPVPLQRIPPEPDRVYRAFGDSALQWLGAPDDNDLWGGGVKVAVLDTGIERHPGLDEDNITRIDLVGGQDGVGNEHGTAVASIIAGVSADARGVAPACELLGIRVLTGKGGGDTFTLARGIVEAVNRGASVINISLTSYGDSFIVGDAVKYAQERGVVIVASVGNDGTDDPAYPASYKGVIGVAAVDAAGQRLYFSNYGKSVSLAAPGLGVNAAAANESFGAFSGTSAAGPFVSGALAMLMSKSKGMTGAEAVDLVRKYADDAGVPGADSGTGAGILDIRRLEQRTMKGIYDAALADMVVSDDNANRPSVLVTAQNRGTEPLRRLRLDVNAGGSQRVFMLENLQTGETAGSMVALDDKAFNADGAAVVTAVVSIDGASDAYPANNGRRIVILRKKDH
jgi:thermitase